MFVIEGGLLLAVVLVNALVVPDSCVVMVTGAIAIAYLVCMPIFGPLTIEVSEKGLCAFATVRVGGLQVPLAEIVHAEVRRFTVWELFFASSRWCGLVYSSKGPRAVLVRLFNGEEVILGCDEPETLVRVLRERIAEVEDASARKSTAGEQGG